MNFSSMEYFVTLARERSFTRAAEQLHITQQSLSSHISGIEKELGCQLVIRHVPLELTYAGQTLLRYASRFQKEYRAMQQEFCDISQNQRGSLRVGVAFTRGRAILPPVILAFQEAYPGITVELAEGTNEELHQMLLNGDVDVAIGNFPEALKGIDLHDYYLEEIVLLISKSYIDKEFSGDASKVEAMKDGDYGALSSLSFLLGSETDIAGRFGRDLLRASEITNPTVKAKSENIETLLDLCLLGAGACFCPKNLAISMLSEEQLKSIVMLRLGGCSKYPIRFGFRKASYQWSIIQAFMDCALGLCPPAE